MGARMGSRCLGANSWELTAPSPEATRGSQREYDYETGQQQYSVLDHEAVPPLLVSPLLASHAHMHSWLGLLV